MAQWPCGGLGEGKKKTTNEKQPSSLTMTIKTQLIKDKSHLAELVTLHITALF